MRILLLAFYFLSADQADYDGEKLTFTGKFQIDHPMGRLQGQKGVLTNPQFHNTGKKGSALTLENGVSIQATKERIPFTLTAQRASCNLPPYTLFSFFPSQELYFYDEVTIQTLHEICAQGGSALYKTGSLTLYPSIPSAHCQLYREGLKNRELAKEAPQIFLAGARGIAKGKTRSEDEKFEAKPTPEKTDFSVTSGIFHENDRIDAKLIRFDLLKETLICEEVQAVLQYRGKMSFALADSLLYIPNEREIVLSATSPKRVLFWQEGFSLSAPEVHLKENQEIEGIGDVHFALDIEEQYTLEKIFSKYL